MKNLIGRVWREKDKLRIKLNIEQLEQVDVEIDEFNNIIMFAEPVISKDEVTFADFNIYVYSKPDEEWETT